MAEKYFAPRAWRACALALGLAAAVLSPALQIATGNPIPYILVLTALIGLSWWITPLDRRGIGLTTGRLRHHGLALLYPVAAMGLFALLPLMAGAASFSVFSWSQAARDIALMTGVTFIGVLISEEGFFRGTLWGISANSGWNTLGVLGWTSLAFMLWHIAVPIIDPQFRLAANEIPVYLANAFLLGVAWGILRLVSGSVLVPCTAHAVWNGLAYTLFGFGEKAGLLSLSNIPLYDPERGLAGIAVNALIVLLLWNWARRNGFALSRPPRSDFLA